MSEERENIEQKSRIVQITGRVSQSVKDEFEQLRDSGGYETFCLFMEALLERYKNPLKINKDNEKTIRDLTETIDRLKERLDLRDKEKQELVDLNGELRSKIEESNSKYDELSRINLQQAGRLDELDGLQHKMDGHILVPVNDLDMRCLEFLAARENKSRKREDITPAVFFQYAIREMLIKGNKFAIDCVPDSVIEKFKKEIQNGQ